MTIGIGLIVFIAFSAGYFFAYTVAYLAGYIKGYKVGSGVENNDKSNG